MTPKRTEERERRKIVAGLFISLDGVVEAPHEWHFPSFNDEMGQAVGSRMAAADTMLLGRATYQEFAAYWPQQGSEVELADFMNNTPKLVVFTTPWTRSPTPRSSWPPLGPARWPAPSRT